MFVFVQLFMRFLQEQSVPMRLETISVGGTIGQEEAWLRVNRCQRLLSFHSAALHSSCSSCFHSTLLFFLPLLHSAAPPAPHLLCSCALLCSTSAPAPSPIHSTLSPSFHLFSLCTSRPRHQCPSSICPTLLLCLALL